MVSPLDSLIRRQVASALRGKLLPCTLRRAGVPSLDSNGDPVLGTPTTYSFEGLRDRFTLQFAQAAGVPVTDAKILVILGSIAPATSPAQDDKVKIRDQWFQLRAKVAADPANATEEWAGYEIGDPT